MINVYTKINSSSGASFKEVPTVNDVELVTKEDLEALEERVKKLEPVVSVGSFFMEGTQNRYEGYRIKIISDTEGNVSEVITGKFEGDEEKDWVDETGIQAGIYGMAWNGESFNDPELIPYNDTTFPTENTFDKEKIMPWAGIKYVEREETVDGVTFKQHLAGVPKFYYTGVEVPANTITLPGATTKVATAGFIQVISSVPLKSFEVFGVTLGDAVVYEEFVDGDKELDFVYDPVYRPVAMKLEDSSIVTTCGVWSDNTDATGDYVLVSQPTSEKGYPVAPRSADIFARKINEGAGYSQATYNAGTWQQYYRMKLLYRIEFNTINSQSVMNGQTSSSATSNAPGWTEEFICKAIEACVPYSGTMDYRKKSNSSSTEAMANGNYQNPLIYRFHSDLFSCPYQLPSNMFIARDPDCTSDNTVYYWLGNCRTCVLNWTGSSDETSCLSDYVQYYDKIAMTDDTGAIDKYGHVQEETWDKNGILTLPCSTSLDNNWSVDEANGYGDFAYLYVGSSDLPRSGSYRFAPVWLSYGYGGCSGDGASGFGAGSDLAFHWGVGNSYAGSGLSLHLS